MERYPLVQVDGKLEPLEDSGESLNVFGRLNLGNGSTVLYVALASEPAPFPHRSLVGSSSSQRP